MDDLSAPRILAGLAGTRFRHVEVHPSIASTQSLLVSEGGADGRLVVADHQTAGRGRAGRSWLDVPGSMLMFSALVRGVGAERAALVSLAAGVAVARGIESIAGGQARLKWPNDVRLDGKKVCGIIGELEPAGRYVVVGIGINVGHERGELPDELDATSVRIALGERPRRDDLCVAIVHELEELVDDRSFMPEYRQRCDTIGSRVRVELGDKTYEGRARDVREDGALVVDERAFLAGDVVHLRDGRRRDRGHRRNG